MQKKITKFLPLLFLLMIWFLFAYPFFLQGKVPYPSTYQVNHFHPWSLDQKYWGPVKNGAMPDIIDQIYPWRHFSIQELKQGSIPWWNPNSFAGNPHIANFQSAALSPLNILFFFLPFVDAWSLLVLLQPLLAGGSMYILLRSFAISKSGSLLGAITWMFCGFIVVWMAYGTLSLAVGLLPLALFALGKYFLTKQLRFGLLLSLVIAASFFAGHFQTSLYLFAVSILYLFYLTCTKKDRNRFLVSCAFLFFGLIISSIQLLPAIQFYNLSPRSDIFLFSGGIPVHYLVSLFAPDFFGNPVTRNDWFGYYAEWASFIGIVPVVFALYSLLLRKNKQAVFFWILAAISLLFSLDTPLLQFLGSLHIPVLSTSTPSRLIVIFSFCIAVLSAFGYDYFRNEIKKKVSLRFVLPMILVGILFLCLWILLFVFPPFSPDKLQIARKNLILPSAMLGGLVFVFFIIYMTKGLQKVQQALLLIPLLFASFDSVRFAGKWMPFDPRELVFPSLPVISAMQQNVGHGRVFGNIGAQVSTYYNVPIIEGYDPLSIDRYGEFIRTSATGEYTPSERSVVRIARNGKYTKRVLDLLGVQLIYHPNADTNQSWAFPVWNDENYVQVYKDDFYSLFMNTVALPRPSLFYKYEVIPDSRKLLLKFYTDTFDYKTTLLLEEDPKILQNALVNPEGSVAVLEDEPTHLTFRVKTNSEALLFVADNYYPGWKAFVNGKEVMIYRADYTFRAIVVPKGESIVEFRYTFL